MHRSRLLASAATASVIGAGLALAVAAPASSAELGCEVEGVVVVTDSTTGAALGWLGTGVVTGVPGLVTDRALASIVSTTVGDAQALTQIAPVDPAHPYIGAVVGPASAGPDLAVGVGHYVVLADTAASAPGAVPAAIGNRLNSNLLAEASIWSLATDDSLSPVWINSDTSEAPTFGLFYNPSAVSNGFILTGDPVAFDDTFGSTTPVSFTLEVTSSVCDVDEEVPPAQPAAAPELADTGASDQAAAAFVALGVLVAGMGAAAFARARRVRRG